MQKCVDPCDECGARLGGSCQTCSSHGVNCGCDSCKKNIKCKLICEKKKEECCHEQPKLCCRISCQEEKGQSKNYQICGNVTLNLI